MAGRIARRISRASALVALVTAGLALTPITASGSAVVVSKTADTADGACDADCSLREAVIAANGLAGPDTITLLAGTFTLSVGAAGEDAAAEGDLDITDALTIIGAGASSTIVDGGKIDRVFDVDPLDIAPVFFASFVGMTIRNGDSGNDDGGGILGQEEVTLDRVVLTGNTGDNGGGIDMDGDVSLSMVDTTVSGNQSLVNSGGIDSDGTATVSHSSIVGNIAENDAGGIDLFGTATITDTTVSGNVAMGNDDVPPEGRGGGIEVRSDTTLTLTNSTVTGNSATADGAGLRIATGGGNSATLNNVTITGNVADSDTGGAPGDGGGISNPEGSVTVKNSVVAGNTDNSGGGPDCAGSVLSQGQFLLGNAAGCAYVAGTGDIVGQDAKLGPLADNGGPTQTHALLSGSPAIDAGGADCVATDQRGLPRKACDIGAYELAFCQKVVVNRVGSPDTDVLTGTPGSDGLLGFQGKDTLRGKAGKDGLCGGPGKDKLRGGGGNDRLDGGPGRDTCAGQAGKKDRARKCETEKAIP